MSPFLRSAFLAGALFLLRADVSAQATYTEDFTSTAFRDAAATTAHWDTSGGAVSLLGPSLVGSYDTAGHAYGVAEYGDLTVVADGSHVRVYYPLLNIELGSVPVPAPGIAKAVVMYGDLAVVATGPTGILVVGVANPTFPVIVSSADTPGDACNVKMLGSDAVVSDGTSMLGVALADPQNPVLLPGFLQPGTVLDAEVRLPYTVIALGEAGFKTQGFQFDTPGFVSDVEIYGDLIFVCDGAEGLKVYSNQGFSTNMIGSYVGNGSATAVEISGDRAYLLDSVDGLVLLDLQDPTTPVLAGNVPIVGAEGLALAGTRVFVAAGAAGLQIVETEVERSSVLGGIASLAADDVAFRDDRLYAVHSNQIDSITILDPENPQSFNVFTSPEFTFNRIELKDNIGVLGTGSSQRVQILDFVGVYPSNPRSAVVGGEPFDIAIGQLGNAMGQRFAWVTTTNGRLERVNLTTAQSQTVATFSSVGGLYIEGYKLFVVAEDRLWLYNISDPENEVLIQASSFTLPGIRHVRSAGLNAYVSRGEMGCWVYSVTGVMSASFFAAGSVDELALDRGLLYLTGEGGTRIFDVNLGQEIGTVPTSPGATRLRPDGNRLYAIDGGVTIFEPIRGLPDTVSNVAQSLSIDGEDKLIDEVRLTSVQEPGVSFEVTADGGVNWQSVPSDGTWTSVEHPGDDLRWRSTHDVVTPGDNPTCSNLVIDWRNPPPTTFCGSDEVTCPCGNAGVGGAGCDLPQGTGGVLLELVEQDQGTSRATFQGTGFPTSSTPTAIVIRAESLEPLPVPFGDGLRCISTPVVRLAATFATGGSSTHAFTHGVMAGPGTFFYQLWFRSSPAMFCTPDAFNLSNGQILNW